jgi:hypothetical protein
MGVVILVLWTQKSVGYVMRALGPPGKNVVTMEIAMNVVMMMIAQKGKNAWIIPAKKSLNSPLA